MKKFKVFDVWMSIGLIISSVSISLMEGKSNFLHNGFLTGYFIVGIWQVFSMLIHLITKTNIYKWNARSLYSVITLVSIITMPNSFWILLYISPFMAIFYTYICYRETYIKMKRPLDDLK